MKGPAETRNLGIQLARGKWVCFLDDDDSFNKDFLAKAASYLRDVSALYFFDYTRVIEVRKGGKANRVSHVNVIHEGVDPDSILVSNFIPNNTFFVDALAARNNPFDANLKSHEDWDWLISLRLREGLGLCMCRPLAPTCI